MPTPLTADCLASLPDIAHGFFSGDEPRFANGVLDAMARALRPGEFQGPPRRPHG